MLNYYILNLCKYMIPFPNKKECKYNWSNYNIQFGLNYQCLSNKPLDINSHKQCNKDYAYTVLNRDLLKSKLYIMWRKWHCANKNL